MRATSTHTKRPGKLAARVTALHEQLRHRGRANTRLQTTHVALTGQLQKTAAGRDAATAATAAAEAVAARAEAAAAAARRETKVSLHV